MRKSGAFPGEWSRRMVVSNSSIWQEELKSTRVTQFPKTSCIHLISTGSGVTLSRQSNKRWSKLSRGRNINWCGPSLTGCLYRYVVVWCTVKTVITCPISKITLCAAFMARETQGCRAIHRDCRYFQHVDCRIVWNLRQDPRLL